MKTTAWCEVDESHESKVSGLKAKTMSWKHSIELRGPAESVILCGFVDTFHFYKTLIRAGLNLVDGASVQHLWFSSMVPRYGILRDERTWF